MLRSALVLLASSGCVSFPSAHLLSAEAQFEAVQAPVVCGPIGFRKIPLQARWGEYVRVTVASPGPLKGTAFVHAGGVALEPVSWSTDTTGALVVEARFPNEDPDRRFVLERERPIDVTLTGLEGSCEGSVFTVEHGVLVPSIDERAWVVELERRGGPELAARREAARVAASARRQAHYAAWESRQHVEVAAEVVAQAELIRQQHYAQWEANHSPLPRGGEGQGEGVASSVSCQGACASPSAGGLSVGAVANTTVSSGGTAQASPICLGTGEVAHSVASETTVATHGTASTIVVVASPAEWSQPSDVSLRTTTSQTTWAQPSDAQLRAGVAVEETWSQPYQPRLDTVAVSTETQVIATQQQQVEVEVEVVRPAAVIVPAMFQLMFNVAAVAGSVQQQPVHGARPVN